MSGHTFTLELEEFHGKGRKHIGISLDMGIYASSI
jgi:hypothetical protein